MRPKDTQSTHTVSYTFLLHYVQASDDLDAQAR
jgi:hypothetical protein